MKKSQKTIVLDALRDARGAWVHGGYFNLTLGITQANARIFELKADGHEIKTREKRGKHGWASHRLVKLNKAILAI